MNFPEDFLDKIICGDCLDVMRQMPDESIDLVVTSPPYNLKNSTGNGMKDGRGGKLYLRVEFCNHCGQSVRFGSGRYANRVPDFNDLQTRIDNKIQFPFGDYVCEECDKNPET